MKQMSIDFYRVMMPDAAPTFEQLVQGVGAEPPDDTRNVEVGGSPVRLQEAHMWDHYHEGEMVRIRMDLLPRKASLDGGLEDLNFEDDEGLGEETAFFYDPRSRLLVVQRNRNGVSASSLVWYFKEKAHLDGPIILEPVLQPDVIQRLADIEIVRRLEITMAGVENGAVFANQGRPVGDIVRLSEQFRAPKISVVLSMGHRRGGLSQEASLTVARIMHALGADHPQQVQKVEIAGINGADEKVVLDLVEERLVESQVLRPGENRTIPYRTRRDALREVWARRREELIRMFQR